MNRTDWLAEALWCWLMAIWLFLFAWHLQLSPPVLERPGVLDRSMNEKDNGAK